MTELNGGSDRAAAIVGGAFVEARLERAIKECLVQEETLQERLFQPSGALGSLGVKIDLAFLLGLLSKEAHADLVIVKKIRNDFAHHLTWNTFEEASIKDRCANLRLVDKLVGDTAPTLSLPPGAITGFPGAKDALGQPRSRYVLTIGTFTTKLAHRSDKSKPFL